MQNAKCKTYASIAHNEAGRRSGAAAGPPDLIHLDSTNSTRSLQFALVRALFNQLPETCWANARLFIPLGNCQGVGKVRTPARSAGIAAKCCAAARAGQSGSAVVHAFLITILIVMPCIRKSGNVSDSCCNHASGIGM